MTHHYKCHLYVISGDATTTICHRYTPPEQLEMYTKTADILVVATGIPNLITADMVKEGVAIIDVGINKVKDQVTGKTKLVGDVDFEGKVYTQAHLRLYSSPSFNCTPHSLYMCQCRGLDLL